MRAGGGFGRRHPATARSRNVAILEQDLAQATLALSLLVLVALAVRQDLAEQRISNALTLAGFGCGVALQWASGGSSGILAALAGAGVGFLCFLPLYLSRGMGAGDVKLMAAAGAFFGPMDALLASLLSLAAGAVLGLLVLARRMYQAKTAVAGATAGSEGGPTLAQFRKERFPYAAAIAVGVVATMWLGGMLEELIS
jgi:prepilin peptidase CpaA